MVTKDELDYVIEPVSFKGGDKTPYKRENRQAGMKDFLNAKRIEKKAKEEAEDAGKKDVYIRKPRTIRNVR